MEQLQMQLAAEVEKNNILMSQIRENLATLQDLRAEVNYLRRELARKGATDGANEEAEGSAQGDAESAARPDGGDTD